MVFPSPGECCLIARDVAIVFHAHCLSPYRFYTDMHHRVRRQGSNLWSRQVAFPLEQLNFLIQNGIWSHQESQAQWEATFAMPYQLWADDPATGAELKLQNVQFTCAWCIQPGIIDLGQFTQTHTTKTAISVCPSCRMQFNADNLSAQHLKRDFAEFLDAHDPW
jgi:hypothetical protein